MRTVIVIALLAFSVLGTVAWGNNTVDVSGDFGRTWLKNLPAEPAPSEDETSGLWGWGGVPKGYKVVNGSLERDDQDTIVEDSGELIWLNQWDEPMALNQSPTSFGTYDLSPFYSDDPWVLAQHYGRPVRTPRDWQLP